MYRNVPRELQVLLAHPGGPFWARKDEGAWSIPKGEFAPEEDPLAAAKREFFEELGIAPQGAFHPLGELTQKGGKIVTAFALEGDLNVDAIRPDLFDMEWPPKSGGRQSFPEVDRAAWFGIGEARRKILSSQAELIDRLLAVIPAKP